MRTTYHPLVLLVLLVALLGCGEEFQFNPYDGTSGLSVEFLENAPPEEFYTTVIGEPLEIGLQVKNEGAFDVPTAYLTLATEQGFVTLNNWEQRDGVTLLGASGERLGFSITGKSMGEPFGGEELMHAYTTARIADPQTETVETKILASLCYPYQTLAHATVCVDTDPSNLQNRMKSCTIQDLSFSGQGAPVAVTDIQTRMLPAGKEFFRPQFTITIENLGGGTVVIPEDAALSAACSNAPTMKEWFNTLKVQEVAMSGFSLSKGDFECLPTTVRLTDDQGEITCTLKPGLLRSNLDTYETDLLIVLKYGYLTAASTATRLYKS